MPAEDRSAWPQPFKKSSLQLEGPRGYVHRYELEEADEAEAPHEQFPPKSMARDWLRQLPTSIAGPRKACSESIRPKQVRDPRSPLAKVPPPLGEVGPIASIPQHRKLPLAAITSPRHSVSVTSDERPEKLTLKAWQGSDCKNWCRLSHDSRLQRGSWSLRLAHGL